MKNIYETTILVVDDNEDNLELVEDMLDDEGYENIICLTSALEAYEELEKTSIDLILLDIMMPQINGIEACKKIKSDKKQQDIPIIIITAKSDLETLKEAFDSGANDYIKKPIINEIELVSRVKNALTLKLHQDMYRELNLTLEKKVKDEIEKNRKKEQLLMHQSKMASMGEMMANIAHQWKQPLNNLGIIVQEIKILHTFEQLDEKKIDEIVAISLKLIKQMSNTVTDFMEFFKPNKTKKIFNVKKGIEEVVTLVEASLKSRGVKLKITSSQEELNIEGCKGEFSQVILNIISNAKDILVEKNIEDSKIDIDISTSDDKIIIKITDNGGGIPLDIIDKVFESYFTTKSKNKGTGIGLYMSKIIIENNMNGKIGVKNSDEGACFIIELKKA